MNLWKKLDIYLLKVSNAIGSNISTEIIRTIKLIYLFKVLLNGLIFGVYKNIPLNFIRLYTNINQKRSNIF